jgi:hypothetical protein
MNRTRLGRLITVLEDADPKVFSMAQFTHACGTPSCVLGHYASRRDIQRTFRLGDHDPIPCDRCGGPEILTNNGKPIGFDDPAVLDHFGITIDEAYELFDSDGCGRAQTPKQAIRFLRKFIASHA